MNFLLVIFIGLLIGARLGYVLFYNLSFYLQNPLAIVSPFDPATHAFSGISGMSYHGGLMGVILAAVYFCRKYEINFWFLADFVIPAIPAGYFFGRMGNFLNGELYGRITDSWWGMYFPNSVGIGQDLFLSLRYPSQLLEAGMEGVILFCVLWPMRNQKKFSGFFLALYLALYGVFRFIIEFWREPDEQIGLFWGLLSLGQLLCFIMILVAAVIFGIKRKKCYN
jgi:phosphatidylglycerol:prolipoprotein diacylglycerol transferase